MCDQQSLRPACAYAQSDQSLCLSLEYSMIVKLLTERQLEFLSLKGSCTGSSESTLVKMSNCWKSHALAQIETCHQTVTIAENRFAQAATATTMSLQFVRINFRILGNIWASSRENLSSGFPTKRVSNQSPQLQRLASKLKFLL